MRRRIALAALALGLGLAVSAPAPAEPLKVVSEEPGPAGVLHIRPDRPQDYT